jgi:hypothetical protein
MERRMIQAFRTAGIRFLQPQDTHEGPNTLDFHLPDHNLYIEVKQFHSDRIARQMALQPNVIVAQGALAVEALALMVEAGGLSK